MDGTELIKLLESFDPKEINVPGTHTKIFKDDKEYLHAYVRKSGNKNFLNIKEIPKYGSKDDVPDGEKQKVQFGEKEVEIPSSSTEPFEKLLSFVVVGKDEDDTKIVPLPNSNLPIKLQQCIDFIIAKDSEKKKMEIVKVTEKLEVSQLADDLQQIGSKKIPKSGWKCSDCDKTQNLWMNLTDGHIGCGRKQYDGTGGNEHAVKHYEKTGYSLVVKLGTITIDGADVFSYSERKMVIDKKLNTHLKYFGIDMETMKKTDKTMDELALESSLRLEYSSVLETGKILKPLLGEGFTGMKNIGSTCYLNALMQVLFSIPELAKRFTDLKMEKYFSQNPLNSNPGENLELQLTKLCTGLNSGLYSVPSPVRTLIRERKLRKEKDEDGDVQMKDKGEDDFVGQDGIPPGVFKNLIGKGHREFSTFRQQDPSELLEHLFTLIDREEQLDRMESFTNLFRFIIEEKTVCPITNMVKIVEREECIFGLPIKTDMSINLKDYLAYEKIRKEEEKQEEVEKQAKLLREAANRKKKELGEPIEEEPPKKKVEKAPVVRPRLYMENVIRGFSFVEFISDFESSAAKQKVTAQRSYRFKSFPKYLIVKIHKYYYTDSWVPKKLDVCVERPEQIDLTDYRSKGLNEGEELMDDSIIDIAKKNAPPEKKGKPYNIGLVQQIMLMGMGFSENACKRACIATNNQSVETAVNWILTNLGNANLNKPLEEDKDEDDSAPVPEDAITGLTSMGIPREAAIYSLRKTNNTVGRAVEYYFNHQEEVEIAVLTSGNVDKPKKPEPKKPEPKIKPSKRFYDGKGRYELFAFISHLGTNTASGHYVCHIKKGETWVLFNDEKVLESQEPPFDRGYIYFYRRV